MELKDRLAQFEEEQRSAANHMREQYADLDQAIKQAEADLVAAKKLRSDMRTAIRVYEPGFELRVYKNGSKPKRSGATKYSDVRLDQMGQWFREHAEEVNALNDGKGFSVTILASNIDGAETPLPNQADLGAVLRYFHEQGLLRLMTLKGRGGSKHYKVVA